jgi:hypothetical protein
LLREPTPIQSEDELFALAGAFRFEPLRDLMREAASGFELLWLAVARRQTVSLVYDGGSQTRGRSAGDAVGTGPVRQPALLTALCHESRIEKSFRIDRIASYRLVD